MVDSPSPPGSDPRSSRSTSRSSSSRSSAVRNGRSRHSKEYSRSRSTKGHAKASLKIVQVANIAPQATREQMQALFGYLGKIDDLRLYPTVDISLQFQSKICFVKFYDSCSVSSAQHLTNTVFIDRALIVIPFLDGEIPDETRALEVLAGGSPLAGIADRKLPQHVTSQIEGLPPLQVVVTKDPRLVESNLPPYPPLPPTVDARQIEEIRRTLVVCNISGDASEQDVIDLFSNAGEVKYFRFCTRDNDPLNFALIEFSDQPALLHALQFNGRCLGDKMIRVYHATEAIIKPQGKSNEAAQKEIEEAMSRQAENLLTHGLDTTVASSGKEKRRGRSSRSRSRERRRSRSKSRRRSSRDRHRSKAKRSRSRSRIVLIRRDKWKRSGSRKRSKSRGRSRKSRSRSHSRRSSPRSKKREEKKKFKKSERRSRSPKSESKKRRRSRPRSSTKEMRSSSQEKKRSKSKKKKRDISDRDESGDSVGHTISGSSSQEKRSKKESSGNLDDDEKSDKSRSQGDIEDGTD